MHKNFAVLREVFEGNSLLRSLQNTHFSDFVLSGNGIDLGSKSCASSYHRFLKLKEGTKIVFTDLYPQSPNILRVDLEKEMPISNDSQDFLILNNVLEHLFNYEKCLEETYRILKPSAKLIGSVPFLYRIHGDPDDYFRYTSSGLIRMFKQAGYEKIEITPLGYGPLTSAATFVAPFLQFSPLIFCTYFLSIAIDELLEFIRISKSKPGHSNYPLGYFFVCEK